MAEETMPKVGDKVADWMGEGGGVVLEVVPYTGLYTQWFKCVLKVSAPRTKAGWLEFAWGP